MNLWKGEKNMTQQIDHLLNCLAKAHSTLSTCSKLLDCCTQTDEKRLYGELSEDAAIIVKKIRNEINRACQECEEK